MSALTVVERLSSTSGCSSLTHTHTLVSNHNRYIYIVCATGKSADEMLAILESRVDNHPDDELQVAAAEQSKITKLRLEKLLAQ